jgi:hypothetical protein
MSQSASWERGCNGSWKAITAITLCRGTSWLWERSGTVSVIYGGTYCAVAASGDRWNGTGCDRFSIDGFLARESCILVPVRDLTLPIRGRSRMR